MMNVATPEPRMNHKALLVVRRAIKKTRKITQSCRPMRKRSIFSPLKASRPVAYATHFQAARRAHQSSQR